MELNSPGWDLFAQNICWEMNNSQPGMDLSERNEASENKVPGIREIFSPACEKTRWFNTFTERGTNSDTRRCEIAPGSRL